MATYRFHGTYAEVRVGSGVKERAHMLTEYGQAIDLDDVVIKEVVDQGCRVMPEGEFLEVFPEAQTGKVNKNDAGFQGKHEALEQLFQTWKDSLLSKK